MHKFPQHGETHSFPIRSTGEISGASFIQACLVTGIVIYADYFDLLGYSTAGLGNIGKYGYFLSLIVCFAYFTVKTRRLNVSLDAPTIFMGFTLISLVPFLLQLASSATTNSYASAFIASLVFSMSINFDFRDYHPNYEKLASKLLLWLVALSALYLGELILRKSTSIAYFAHPINAENHLKSIVLVPALCLALYLRSGSTILAAICFLIVATEILRPESTLLLALAVCVPITILIRLRRFSTAKSFSYAVLIFLAALPFILHSSDEIQQWIITAEGYLKSDILGGVSNTVVRLKIIDVAFERFNSSSWLFGELFSGSTSVQIGRYFSWWIQGSSGIGVAAIHSDYVSVLLQGGLLGYFFFNLALLLVIRTTFSSLSKAARDNQNGRLAITAMAIPVTLVIALVCSTNPFLQLWQVAHMPWFLLFCAEISRRGITARLHNESFSLRQWHNHQGQKPIE